MESRSLRPKRSVDYSAETSGSNTPAWLRTERKLANPDASAERRLDLDGIEKENETPPGQPQASKKNKKAAGKPKNSRSKKAAAAAGVVEKVADTANSKPQVVEPAKPRGGKAASSKAKPAEDAEVLPAVKEPRAAVRGRNAGMQVVEIEDASQRGKGRRSGGDSGKRASEEQAEDSAEAAANNRKKPKPNKAAAQQAQAPAAASEAAASARDVVLRPVPGLPGVSQRAPAALHQPPAVPSADATAKEQPQAQEKAAPAGRLRRAAKGQEPSGSAAAEAMQEATAVPLPTTDAAAPHDTFQKMKAELDAVQRKYEELKAKRMEEVDAILEEQERRFAEHSRRAQKMVDNWRAEAEHQAALAKQAGLPDVRDALAALHKEASNLKHQVMELEAEGLAKDERIAHLQRQLAAALAQAEAPHQTTRAVQAALPPVPGTAVSAQFPTPGQAQSVAGQHSHATPAAPAVPERSVRYVHEAVAMVPEGADLSELYRHPEHAFSALQQYSESPATAPMQIQPPPASGQVHCNSSAKPLVPYALGMSASQAPRRSRFAEELNRAQAVGAAVETASNAAMVNQPAASAEPGPAEQLPAATAPDLSPAKSFQDEAGHADAAPEQQAHEASQVVERQLQFSLASGQPAEQAAQAQPCVSENMSLTGSDQINEKTGVTNKALNLLVGLAAAPASNGGFTFTHAQSGFVFQIGPADPNSAFDSDGECSEEEEVAYKPLHLGDVLQVLPGYLQSEIQFAPSQKQMLVSRIMESLSKFRHRSRPGH